MKDYITTSQAAVKLGISDRRVCALFKAGRIPGAILFGNRIAIPKDFTVTDGKRGPKFTRLTK